MKLTKELTERIRKLPAGNIADNNPEGYVLNPAIKPLDPKLTMVGRAFTVQCRAKDNLALHQAIAKAQAGDVMIFDCEGCVTAGHFGDMMANACKVKGLAGVVINGSCRDAEDIRTLGFPVFSKGLSPAPTRKDADAVMHETLNIDGAVIHDGDIIFGDCDGVLVIPEQEAEKVFEEAFHKFEKEKEVLQEILSDRTTLEIFNFREGR